jgi:23S rRNA pseudouridine1911/1915/1917 synthase
MMRLVKKGRIIKVTGGEQGEELIGWMARKLDISRNAAKRLIDTRQVFVNRQRVWMARHTLKTGDMVEILVPDEKTVAAPARLDIRWRDDHYLIINKPPGWLANGPGSVEARLAEELGKPVHAVHRLDRDTSGCMLLAWHKGDREKMIPVFQQREVIKVYEGLVIGKIPPGLDVINRKIEGEEAITRLKVLRRVGDIARVEFILVTGRTHQIRRHLTMHQLHLAGDKNYGSTLIEKPTLRAIPRHMLHAKLLGFPHPVSGKFIEVRAPLPDDYRAAAKVLGVG